MACPNVVAMTAKQMAGGSISSIDNLVQGLKGWSPVFEPTSQTFLPRMKQITVLIELANPLSPTTEMSSKKEGCSQSR